MAKTVYEQFQKLIEDYQQTLTSSMSIRLMAFACVAIVTVIYNVMMNSIQSEETIEDIDLPLIPLTQLFACLIPAPLPTLQNFISASMFINFLANLPTAFAANTISTQFSSEYNIDDIARLTISGDKPGDVLGYAVTYLNDINGDGIADLAVSSPWVNGKTGTLYILWGNQGLLTRTPGYMNVTNLDSSVGCQIVGREKNSQTGFSLREVDLNRDKYSDLLIGSNESTGVTNSGAVYGFLGGPNFCSTGLLNLSDTNTTPYTFVVHGPSVNARLGTFLGNTASWFEDNTNQLLFSAIGVGGTYMLNVSDLLNGSTVFNMSSFNTSNMLKFTHASSYVAEFINDMNQDGHKELFLGAPLMNASAGAGLMFLGGHALPAQLDLTTVNLPTVLKYFGEALGDVLGNSGCELPNLRGLWKNAYALGATRANNDSGRVYIVLEHANLSNSLSGNNVITIDGSGTKDYFARVVGPIKNFDSNVSSALMVTNSYDRDTNGTVTIIHNFSRIIELGGQFSTDANDSSIAFKVIGRKNNLLGFSVAAGDIDGDGIDDWIFGAPGYNINRGAVDVVRGDIISYLTRNSWSMHAGQTILINSSHLNATCANTSFNGRILFTFSNVSNGVFWLLGNPLVPVFKVLQQFIFNHSLYFTHFSNSSMHPQVYTQIEVNGLAKMAPQLANITFNPLTASATSSQSISSHQTVSLSKTDSQTQHHHSKTQQASETQSISGRHSRTIQTQSQSPTLTMDATPTDLDLELLDKGSKIAVLSKNSSIVKVIIDWLDTSLGRFMTTALNLGPAVITQINNQLTVVGNPTNVSYALKNLRFSANPGTNNTPNFFTLRATKDGSYYLNGVANLGQFGTNRAPIHYLNASSNFTFNLGEPVSINLVGRNYDPDGDPLQYNATIVDAPWLLQRGTIIGGVSTVGQLVRMVVQVTDGYLSTDDAILTNIYYQEPTVKMRISPYQTFIIGKGATVDTTDKPFAGYLIREFFIETDGYQLPSFFKLTSNGDKPTVTVNPGIRWAGNVTLIGQDIFGARANQTFFVRTYNPLPVVSNPLQTRIQRAWQAFLWYLDGVFTSSSPYPIRTKVGVILEGKQYALSVIPGIDWRQNLELLSGKFPVDTANKTVNFWMEGCNYPDDDVDPTACVDTEFSVMIPANIGPIVNQTIPAISVQVKQNINFDVPRGTFVSAVGNDLEFSLRTNSGTKLATIDPVLGRISWSADVPGTYYMDGCANDVFRDMNCTTITINVNDVEEEWYDAVLRIFFTYIAPIGFPLTVAIGGYAYRHTLLNFYRGKTLVKSDPFLNDKEYVINDIHRVIVNAYRLRDPVAEEIDCIRQAALFMTSCSYYIHSTLRHAPLESGERLPSWIIYDTVLKKLILSRVKLEEEYKKAEEKSKEASSNNALDRFLEPLKIVIATERISVSNEEVPGFTISVFYTNPEEYRRLYAIETDAEQVALEETIKAEKEKAALKAAAKTQAATPQLVTNSGGSSTTLPASEPILEVPFLSLQARQDFDSDIEMFVKGSTAIKIPAEQVRNDSQSRSVSSESTVASTVGNRQKVPLAEEAGHLEQTFNMMEELKQAQDNAVVRAQSYCRPANNRFALFTPPVAAQDSRCPRPEEVPAAQRRKDPATHAQFIQTSSNTSKDVLEPLKMLL